MRIGGSLLMLNIFPVRLLWHSFNWLTRLTIEVLSAIAILAAVFVIVLRYSILPSIEQYHGEITDSFSTAIGHPVTIGSIEGDWRGVEPRLRLSDVHILNDRQQTELVLQKIDASVSWMSLLTLDLRFADLEIFKPELMVRRNPAGDLFVGGLPLSGKEGDGSLADWLLRQSRLVVRDALIVWTDEQRDAPPLVLQQVNLRIESFFNNHSFALSAFPPAELAAPLDLRGEFSGASINEFKEWRGQIFTQLDYIDVTRWRPWLDMPAEFSNGRGAIRGWMGIEGANIIRVIADMDLRDVETKLASDVPEMMLLKLRGRVTWWDGSRGAVFSSRKLEMHLKNGIELRPTDLYFSYTQAGDGQPAGGEIRANLLQLEDLVSLAKYLPLEAVLREGLDAYAPSGKVSRLDVQWQGELQKLDSYSIKGQLENIAVRQVGKFPGFSGLTAEVDGSDVGGRLNISSNQVVLEAPGIMRETLYFNILTGQVGWMSEEDELLINIDNVAVANDDLAGNLYGSYKTQSGTAGILNLTARLTRGDIRRAARYTPLIALHKDGNDWLNGALLAGHTEDFRIRIKGNLSDFPLDGSKDVLFKIGGHAKNAVMEFAKDWPRIENISGEFLINGNRMEVIAPSATMAGAHLQHVVVSLPDMSSQDLALEINGEALAENNTFLDFIQQSPVRGYIDGFTDGVRASGNGHLALFLRIPLQGKEDALAQDYIGEADVRQGVNIDRKPVQVSGNLHVQQSDIDLGAGIPWLRDTSGVLTFTESGMHANDIKSRILGGAASIDVEAVGGGKVHAVVRGYSNLDVLHKHNKHPLLDYLGGGSAWDADISIVNKQAQFTVRSDLEGIESRLPQPFIKTAKEVMPLKFEKMNLSEGRDVIAAQLGNLLSVRLERSGENGERIVRTGEIILGSQTESNKQNVRKSRRKRNGLWLTGSLPEVSVQGWGGVAGATDGSAFTLPVAGINLTVGNLFGYGKTVGAVKFNSIKREDGLAIKLSGGNLGGEIVWLPRGYKTQSKLSARLTKLHLLDGTQPELLQSSPKLAKSVVQNQNKRTAVMDPGNVPALEIAIESLQLKGNPIGRIDFVGHPDGRDWRLRRLNISNSDGSFAGDGVWRVVNSGTQTQVNLQLMLSDVGNVLSRSGYPDTVKGGSGRLAANVSWIGSPDQFEYATLNGTLKLDTGKGQFLKMDPGAGKLLSILSLQALPKHITLDFTDVFSSGFQFDNINGNATINNGVIDTQDLHIDGSAAKVTMKGTVNLNDETQNLRVRILPSIGAGVSLIGAFAAGPAVGIGTLIVSKVLGDPLDKLVSFEYNVDGTWANPNVVKIGGVKVKPSIDLN